MKSTKAVLESPGPREERLGRRSESFTTEEGALDHVAECASELSRNDLEWNHITVLEYVLCLGQSTIKVIDCSGDAESGDKIGLWSRPVVLI
jgi:hypothetical protein